MSSISTLGSLYESRLMVQSFRAADATNAARGGSPERSTRARVLELVDSLKNRLLNEARRGDTGLSSLQDSVNVSLSELAYLLQSDLKLGGAENALIEGIDTGQISNLEVRHLSPNSAAVFGQIQVRSARPAAITIADANNLTSVGGSLQFEQSGRSGIIDVARGMSISDLARSINSRGLGVRAQTIGRTLQLFSSESNPSYLKVVDRRGQFIPGSTQSTLEGQNPAHIRSVTFDNVSTTDPLAISGSRDSLSSHAEAVYLGNPQGRVTGSASFDLSGASGTVNIDLVEGELLTDVEQRVNQATDQTGITATASGGQLTFRSVLSGSDQSVSITNVQREVSESVSGVNSEQFTNATIDSIPVDTELTVSGSITQAADSARLTYHGGTGSTVIDSATFALSGTLGSSEISISQNESLFDVRDRINNQQALTGIVAEVYGNDLQFQSVAVGSAASVSVELGTVPQYIDVSGVNAAQVSDFSVLWAENNSTNALDATVTQTATQGQLTYTGVLGAVERSAQFTLTGELGSKTISVSVLQSLSSVRDTINAVSSSTGVVASVQGSALTLSSQKVGSSAVVQVAVQSGSFTTSGGDGNGNAAGTDAVLTINGDSVVADRNAVSYSDAVGSYEFSIVPNHLGAVDQITVTSSAGSFAISGGDPSGTSYGVDAEAELNGQTLTGIGNQLTATFGSTQIALTATAGSTGSIAPIIFKSSLAEFSTSGLDQDGSASGEDGSATINGVTYTSASDEFTAPIADGTVTLDFTENFTGDFDPLSWVTNTIPASSSGESSRAYFATGTERELTFRGEAISAVDGRYTLQSEGVEIAFNVASGFSGAIQPFTISAAGNTDASYAFEPLEDESLQRATIAIADLFEIASGGAHSIAGDHLASALSLSFEVANRLRDTLTNPPAAGILDVTL